MQGNRAADQAVGVAQVEAERNWRIDDIRLVPFPLGKAPLLRLPVGIAGEQVAHEGPGYQGGVAIFFEAVALLPLPFLFRHNPVKALE